MRRLSCVLAALAALLGACKMDNYAPPGSSLSGRLVYQGQPVGVRKNAIQLELWQDGYALHNQIPVYVDQDGSFRAALFDGQYKLNRKLNGGPWVNQSDTIPVAVAHNATVDVPVTPFFVVANPKFARSGTTLSADFSLQQPVASAALEQVVLVVGTSRFVDVLYNFGQTVRTAAQVGTDVTAPISMTFDLTKVPADKDSVFVRVGVKTKGVAELLYSPVTALPMR